MTYMPTKKATQSQAHNPNPAGSTNTGGFKGGKQTSYPQAVDREARAIYDMLNSTHGLPTDVATRALGYVASKFGYSLIRTQNTITAEGGQSWPTGPQQQYPQTQAAGAGTR